MCAFTDSDPFYNCDEKWVVYWYPQEKDVFKYCYPEVKKLHWFILGCAEFDDERGHSIIIGSAANEMYRDSEETVFQHEIRHLKCRCNFHE